MSEKGRVTLHDVANRASVSLSAAAAALRGEGRLHEDTRARILEAAEELGYRRNALARSLRRSGNGVVVSIMYGMPNSDSSRRPKTFWEDAIFGYVRELAMGNLGTVFLPADRAEMIANLPTDVVVIFNLPQDSNDEPVTIPNGIPTIRVVSTADADSVPEISLSGPVGSVIWDVHAAIDDVFTHLRDAGSQSPGLLLPAKPLMPTALIRSAQDQWCLKHAVPMLRSESPDIAEGTRELLELGCDGFVVHGDDRSGDIDRTLDTIRSAALEVPQDVLLASISDGTRESLLEPPVTSLIYHGVATGVRTARAVIHQLKNGQLDEVVIGWDLQVRESTTR